MGRSVSRRRREQPEPKVIGWHERWKAGANSLALSAVGIGIAAVIVALTSIAAWIATLIATAILVIGLLARERRKPVRR